MRYCARVLLAALGLSLSSSAHSSTPDSREHEAGWHRTRNWTQSDGLPQNSVYCVLQTHDGYIWVGTRAGLARFDGVRFVTFDGRDANGLNEKEVWSLVEGDDHSLWIATFGGGVDRMKDGRFTHYTTREGLASDFAAAVAKGKDGAIWVATDGGVSVFRDGRFTTYTAKDGIVQGAARSLHVDDDGTVWVGTVRGGLNRIVDGRVFTEKVAEIHASAEVRAIGRDGEGSLWIGTTEGLVRIKDGKSRRLTKADGLADDRIYAVYLDGGGHLWVGTDNGLARYDHGRFVVEIAPGEAGRINAISSDAEGTLWVGSLRDGLARLRQGLFVTYTAADGLGDDYTSGVIADREGRVWIGTANGLTLLHQGRIRTYTIPGASNRVNTLTLDRAGDVWIGTFEGVYRVRLSCPGGECAPRFEPVRPKDKPRLFVRVIHADPDGTMWVGTNLDGLLAYRDGHWTEYTTANGLSSNAIRGLVSGTDGSLWIATRGGLNHLRGGSFTVYQVKDGLPNDNLQTLYLDSEDSLWLATRRGVSRFKDGRFTTLTLADGLFSSFIYSFIEDGLGNLWMSCGKGLFRVPLRELTERAEGRRQTVTSTAYGVEHGLATTVMSIVHYPGAYRTEDGNIWFTSLKGVAVVDPRRLATNRLAPPVLIEEVRIDGSSFTSPAQVPAGRGDITFRYTGLSFVAPEKMSFRYRLFGYDADWIDPGTRRVAYYTNIPPGPYRFQVAASNSEGLWNEKGAAFELVLAPHFYETRAFYVLCVVAATLAGAASQQLRLRYVKAREQMLSRRVDKMVSEMKIMHGLLPICASCKKIRDDTGYWSQIETYIQSHSQAEFSHGVCPDCLAKLYPEYVATVEERIKTGPTEG